MSSNLEIKLTRLPLIKQLVFTLQKIKLPWLKGLSLYDLLYFYINGLINGKISNRAAAIAFSFFMAIFPFLLFIFNLIPYIPIQGFQEDFLGFVKTNVPPTTYNAINSIINDILHNSHSDLLSTGFLMSIYLMSNGMNAIINGFQSSSHVEIKHTFFKQILISLFLSIVLTFILLVTVATIIVFEVLIQKTIIQEVLINKVSDKISLIQLGRYIFVILMILFSISILFKFSVKQIKKKSIITIGTVFTTILILLSSYFFGIWVVKFSKYNELYGSIGTLLIVMFYIWINCMILLLGFELDLSISKLKNKSITNV